MPTLRVIGPGRAGTAMSRALETAGWTIAAPIRRGEDLRGAARGADLLLIATPDAVVAAVAGAVEAVDTTVLAHRAAIAEDELPAYDVMVEQAARLVASR